MRLKLSNGLLRIADGDIGAQYSANVRISLDSDLAVKGYVPSLLVKFQDADGEVVEGICPVIDGEFAIPGNAYTTTQVIMLTVSSVKGDETINSQPLYVRINAGNSGGTEILPSDEDTWKTAVKAYVDGLLAATNEKILQVEGRVEVLEQSGGGSGGSGLTPQAKEALMAVVEDIALWKSQNAQEKIDALRTALYSAPLSSIEAEYTQDKNVYPTDDLDVLRSGLRVTARYSDGSSSVVSGYTLRGSLTVGRATITVEYGGKSATFSVTVSEARIPATGINLSQTSVRLTSEPVTITATVVPSNSTDSVAWTSSEDAVATVDGGVITPVASGNCVIRATAGEISVECSVVVDMPLNAYIMPQWDDDGVVRDGDPVVGKWYRNAYSTWSKKIFNDNTGYYTAIFAKILPAGEFWYRTAAKSQIGYPKIALVDNDAFENPKPLTKEDIIDMDTIKSFDVPSEYKDRYQRPYLGEQVVDGETKSDIYWFILLNHGTIPQGKYGIILNNAEQDVKIEGATLRPDLSDWRALFRDDPSGNILQRPVHKEDLFDE